MTRPYFSVIVPMYNRAALVPRALDSVLRQDFTDFEVVVTDDGSTDDSVAVVRRYAEADPRVRLVVHERNKGRCPSRNTAMEAARGEWFVFLDSDDELVPGALALIHARAERLPPGVGSMRFMCAEPDGTLSPDPPHRDETWTYEEYVSWLERTIESRGETLPCARASTFPSIRYPEGHAEEGLYHLDLARAHRVQTLPDVVRVYHQDAPNQISRPDFRRALRFAADNARNVDDVLARHGDALRQHAPRLYATALRRGVMLHFLAGRRGRALRYTARCLRQTPLEPKLWAAVAAGMIHRSVLARLQAWSIGARRGGAAG